MVNDARRAVICHSVISQQFPLIYYNFNLLHNLTMGQQNQNDGEIKVYLWLLPFWKSKK